MKTLLEVILDGAETTLETAKLSAKEVVLLEDSMAKCTKITDGYRVSSRGTYDYEIYGEGATKDQAWEAAVFTLYIRAINENHWHYRF